MLLGVPPFASETPQGYIMKHLTQPPRRFRETSSDDWPAGLEAVIFRVLEKDRRNRFADAREMAAALQPFLSAPAGTLTRDDVNRIRRGPDQTLVATVAVDTTEAKARAFELSLIETVRAKEAEGDRDALQRLAEAHPPGTAVGDAAREALARAGPREDEEAVFQQTWESGTSAAWQQFIAAHPNSAHIDEAKLCRQEAVDFELALASDNATMWRAFVKAWPEGRHRLDADIRLRAKK